MSFWESRKIKAARKEHDCQYCGKKIYKGESYSREVGIWEDGFDHYCLCNRCRWFLNTYRKGSEELGDLRDDMYAIELFFCPMCDSRNIRFLLIDNVQKAACECKQCESGWIEELSEENIEYIKYLGSLDHKEEDEIWQ